MTAPRVPTEHYDAAAVRFWTRATCSLFVLGVACSWLMAMWLVADWRISGRVFAAAVVAFVCGVGCWLASKARADAIEGPPDEVYDAVEERAHEDYPRSIVQAGRQQSWCPTCESPSRDVRFIDEGDGLPCGDPIGWHTAVTS